MLSKRNFVKLMLGAVLASNAAFGLAADLPDDSVAIHYHRPDGKYQDWGVHLWRRAGGSPDLPLEGISWGSPMMPTGEDDFGVFWQRRVAEFGKDGKVYYIIHKGDRKEQLGRDMDFDPKKGREVWVVSGDKNIYFSKEEALKAIPKQ